MQPIEKPKDYATRVVIAILGSLFVLAAFVAIDVSRKSSYSPNNSKPDTALTNAPAQPAAKTYIPPPPENWHYSTSTDEMTGKSIRAAMVVSTNTVEFGFPYGGAQHATLLFREHPRHGKDVILSIEKGQFLCGYGGCSVSVRFDEAAPRRFSAAEAADNSTTTLFIRNYSAFVAEARKAKMIRIEALFYAQGSFVFAFDVAGIKW